jgi:glycerol-3-phosphate acyltransferase PlsX
VTGPDVTGDEPLIAVDAMGGDDAPAAVVLGALASVAAGRRVVLVGDEAAIEAIIPTGGPTVEVITATEVVEMDDDPAMAVRRKKDSSTHRAVEAVRDGRADAFVGFGNTGATMGVAVLRLGRISGVKRPAMAAMLPVPHLESWTVLLDVGANVECTPAMLEQFARMGVAFSRAWLGREVPRVGVLNIGEEAGKGTELTQAAVAALSSDFENEVGAAVVGNVEGTNLCDGSLDVVVTDGFTGNIAVKTVEGTSANFIKYLRARLGDEADAGALEGAWDVLEPDSHNGAVLLGVKGIAVVGHGSSSPGAVSNAIDQAAQFARVDLSGAVASAIAR